MAADDFAEPWLLGTGPITGDDGSDTAAGAGLGADLHAANMAALALAAAASNQNRRGALVLNCSAVRVAVLLGLSSLIVVWLQVSCGALVARI